MNETTATDDVMTSTSFVSAVTDSVSALTDSVSALTDSVTFGVLNYTTAILSTSTMTTAGENICPGNHVLCNESYKDECLNDGICCWNERTQTATCRCQLGWTGPRCSDRNYELDFEFSRQITMISLSSIISLLIGLMALMAFVVLAILIIRKKLTLRHVEPGFDENLREIEDELSKMPTITRLKHLTQLSRKFEASVRVTLEESAAEMENCHIKTNLSPSARECLPRWSSAPSVLQSSPQHLDGVDSPDAAATGNGGDLIPLTSIKRLRLQKVFSTPS